MSHRRNGAPAWSSAASPVRRRASSSAPVRRPTARPERRARPGTTAADSGGPGGARRSAGRALYMEGVDRGGDLGSTEVKKREMRAGGPVPPVTRAGLLTADDNFALAA